jgi:hypothetical protein
MTADPNTLDMFADAADRPGDLSCAVEIAATISEALERARNRGLPRAEVARKMGWHLGERLSENMLDAYAAQSHDKHEISLRRAIALDMVLGEDALLRLYVGKRGGRSVMSDDDAALLEWARLHREEKALSERKRALEAVLRTRPGK